jgi:hypothetical protein
MFCNSCGEQITDVQPVCGRCGKPTSAGVMRGGGVFRVAQHYRTIGILWIVYSVLTAIAGAGALFVAKFFFEGIAQAHQSGPPIPGFVGPIVQFVGVLLLAKGALGIVAGIGLLAREPWARVLTLVDAFISLVDIPIGLALGIYSIWALMSSGADDEYRKLAEARS